MKPEVKGYVTVESIGEDHCNQPYSVQLSLSD